MSNEIAKLEERNLKVTVKNSFDGFRSTLKALTEKFENEIPDTETSEGVKRVNQVCKAFKDVKQAVEDEKKQINKILTGVRSEMNLEHDDLIENVKKSSKAWVDAAESQKAKVRAIKQGQEQRMTRVSVVLGSAYNATPEQIESWMQEFSVLETLETDSKQFISKYEAEVNKLLQTLEIAMGTAKARQAELRDAALQKAKSYVSSLLGECIGSSYEIIKKSLDEVESKTAEALGVYCDHVDEFNSAKDDAIKKIQSMLEAAKTQEQPVKEIAESEVQPIKNNDAEFKTQGADEYDQFIRGQRVSQGDGYASLSFFANGQTHTITARFGAGKESFKNQLLEIANKL